MPRRHVFEVHEQDWCPDILRLGTTNVLQIIANVLPTYNHIAPQIKDALQHTAQPQVVDLCSGAGGPWLKVSEALHELDTALSHVTLTDEYPNPEGFRLDEDNTFYTFVYEKDPIDAMDVPSRMQGLRTIFAAFHHFKPDEAKAILHDAVRKGEPIAIYEITERHPMTMFFIALAGPLFVFFGLPFVRPFRPAYLLWAPILAITLTFDGLMSCLRTYSVEELHELVNDPELQAYDWQIGREQPRLTSPLPVIYLVGTPKA